MTELQQLILTRPQALKLMYGSKGPRPDRYTLPDKDLIRLFKRVYQIELIITED